MPSDRQSTTAIIIAHYLIFLNERPGTALLLPPGAGGASKRLLAASNSFSAIWQSLWLPGEPSFHLRD